MDQEQTQVGSWIQFVGAGPAGTYAAAQTFQVGLSGTLGEIRLHGGVSNFASGTGPLIVEVYPTVAGVPDESGAPLLTQSVPFAALPPVFFPAEYGIDVAAHGLEVQAGEVLAVVLSVPSGTVDLSFRSGLGGYAPGGLWSRADPAGTWASVGPADAFFRIILCPAAAVTAGDDVTAQAWGATKAAYR